MERSSKVEVLVSSNCGREQTETCYFNVFVIYESRFITTLLFQCCKSYTYLLAAYSVHSCCSGVIKEIGK